MGYFFTIILAEIMIYFLGVFDDNDGKSVLDRAKGKTDGKTT